MFQPSLEPREISAILPDFTPQTELRKSGQGIVYQASSKSYGDVALKIYFPSQEDERIRREADLLKSLQLPTLVALRDFGSIELRGEVCFYTATAFEKGADLADKLKTEKSLEQLEVVKLMSDIATTIEALWSPHKIIHCDLKPANILVGVNNYKVVDLGLAKYLHQPGITQTGVIMGTSGYMAPEQMKGRRHLTTRVDLFALGIIAYQAITGAHPFNGIQRLIGRNLPADPAAAVPNINNKLSNLLGRLLSFDPMGRPATARDVLKDLSEIRSDLTN